MHYLKINDSDKKKIGYLIHVYRTQQFKHLSQNSFLLNEYNEPICTRQTLSKIEQGVIIKNDSIYEELLKKMNLKFNTDYCIEKFLPTSIFSDLLNACDYYNLEKLISISESYIKQLNPFKEYIFFHEYYECFKWIYTYYSSFELPTLQSTEYIILLKNIINSDHNEVMMDLVLKKRTTSGIYVFSCFDFKEEAEGKLTGYIKDRQKLRRVFLQFMIPFYPYYYKQLSEGGLRHTALLHPATLRLFRQLSGKKFRQGYRNRYTTGVRAFEWDKNRYKVYQKDGKLLCDAIFDADGIVDGYGQKRYSDKEHPDWNIVEEGYWKEGVFQNGILRYEYKKSVQ